MKKKVAGQEIEIEDKIDPTVDVSEDVEIEEDEDSLDETAAAESIKAKGVPSRLDIMTNTVSAMAKMGDTELTKWFQQAIQTSSQYSSTGLDDSEKNKASISAKPSATGANPMGPLPFVPVCKEDLEVVFEAMGVVDEDLKSKTLTLFEAAINARLVLEVTRIEEEYESKLVEEIEAIREDLTDKVDQYLDYAAQEFVNENEVAIENALKLELFEDFMGGLKNLFEEHYIEVPEDKLDVLTSMSEKVVELEEKLNAEIENGLVKQNTINEMVAQKVFAEVSEGLSVTQTEKLKTLVETVEFDGTDVDGLRNKLTIIKEANFKEAPKKAPKTGIIAEETEVVITGDIDADGTVEIKKPDPRVASYVSAISRSTKGAGR